MLAAERVGSSSANLVDDQSEGGSMLSEISTPGASVPQVAGVEWRERGTEANVLAPLKMRVKC